MLTVFIRGSTPDDLELLGKFLSYGGVEQYEIFDLSAKEISGHFDIGLAVGPVARRLVQTNVDKLFSIPVFKNLYKKPENEKARAEAAQTLATLKNNIDNPNAPEVDEKDIYFLLSLSDDKKLCVYKEKKPNLKVYSFISFQEYQILLQIKETTGATSITFGKENLIVGTTPDPVSSDSKEGGS